MKKVFLSALLMTGLVSTVIFFISGCAQQVRTVTKKSVGSERIFDKNYEVGKELTSYVGQPIIKVKDYRIKKYNSNEVIATENFTMTLGAHNFSGNKSNTYKIYAETTVNNENFRIVKLPSLKSPQFKIGILINNEGDINKKTTLVKSLSNNDLLDLGFKLDFSPSTLKFVTVNDEEIDVNAGFINYELIYGGTDGKSINISYREYTAENMARPAFYQDLTYQIGKKTIRFKNTIIEVYESSNEKIIYKVISDGL